jgi:hypothetical protein
MVKDPQDQYDFGGFFVSSGVEVRATVTGWLTEDAVLKDLGNYEVCKFCVKAEKYDRQQKKKVHVFINCDLWGKRAETMRKMLRKGKYVQVSGEIETFRHIDLRVDKILLLSQAKQEGKEQEPAPKEEAPKPVPSEKDLADIF